MSETYHHGNLRNALISGGLRMLARDGIASFSLRRLSTELGVSHTAAYRHFSSREDLLRAIMVESSCQFNEALANAVPCQKTGQEALMRLGIGYVRFFLAHPEVLALFNLLPAAESLLQGLLPDTSDPDSAICHGNDWTDSSSGERSPAFSLLSSFALQLRSSGRFTDLSNREILLGYWAKVHGLASLLVTQKNFIPPEDVEKAVEKIVMTPF